MQRVYRERMDDSDKRSHGARIPVGTDARLRIGSRTLSGTTRDIGLGGVFFATTETASVGDSGVISRAGGEEGVSVRVAWTRDASHPEGAGLGLEFES